MQLLSPSPLISSQRLSLYTSWRRSIQSGIFQHQILAVSHEELTLPRSACCALSRLRCNGRRTLLGTYLLRVGQTETPSCSNCDSESHNLFYLVLDWPALDSIRLAIFDHSSLFWTSDLVSGRLPNYWDSAELIRAHIPRNGSGKPTATVRDQTQGYQMGVRVPAEAPRVAI